MGKMTKKPVAQNTVAQWLNVAQKIIRDTCHHMMIVAQTNWATKVNTGIFLNEVKKAQPLGNLVIFGIIPINYLF